MCMKLYRGLNRPRSKRMVVHLDKMATILNIGRRIDKWLDRQLLSRELCLESSTATKDEIDWDDFRIRRLSPEEQSGNSKYWMMRMQTSITRTVVNTPSAFLSCEALILFNLAHVSDIRLIILLLDE